MRAERPQIDPLRSTSPLCVEPWKQSRCNQEYASLQRVGPVRASHAQGGGVAGGALDGTVVFACRGKYQ